MIDERASGVLPRQTLRQAVDLGWIVSNADTPDRNFQPASLDLTVGPVAYRLQSSFLPGSMTVREKLRDYVMDEIDLTAGGVLERGRPYLIPLQERLRLPEFVRARANPRSSTGRLDVFTRLIVDRGQRFDEVKLGYQGELFLEVVSRSFTIKLRQGYTLNQLRLIVGAPRVSDAELYEISQREHLVFGPRTVSPGETAPVHDGIFLSVDLSRSRNLQYVGYKAKKSSALLDLSVTGKYKIADFWDRIGLDRRGRLILEPEEFYLLVSRERVRIPLELAAEMAAYDPTSGELRTHYAGFFDPGFGVVPPDQRQGTAAVLEVRAHDVAFALEHGQRLCKLTFERMLSAPDKAYGQDLGSRYQRQYLAVGRQFVPDPPSRMEAEHNPELFGEEPLKLELIEGEPDALVMPLELST
ncbi:MAG TPA: 2'-deoxycytidine 5'-triphosphate deaminase [Candidatus Binatia bacterium]|nr:2'-deoxycytidine 5'-triphosphate deaminase [Candidatus Binatia bacterium]